MDIPYNQFEGIVQIFWGLKVYNGAFQFNVESVGDDQTFSTDITPPDEQIIRAFLNDLIKYEGTTQHYANGVALVAKYHLPNLSNLDPVEHVAENLLLNQAFQNQCRVSLTEERLQEAGTPYWDRVDVSTFVNSFFKTYRAGGVYCDQLEDEIAFDLVKPFLENSIENSLLEFDADAEEHVVLKTIDGHVMPEDRFLAFYTLKEFAGYTGTEPFVHINPYAHENYLLFDLKMKAVLVFFISDTD
eukprot:TRINITY_DN8225_c0_g1_i1.p1 TRINITY_DN8225_c0_g1~~TRINITY_DN8225_c0_g1_i1.p1  ORF type:complete len:244 (-),score=42.46 TRINITY_DN8225_c0_g1_i1:74-805(-)